MDKPETALDAGARRAGPFSASALKLIAIVAMAIDHSGNAFFADYYQMPAVLLHTIGRITGPIMFYFLVEGYHHTRNKNQYTLRLALFAAVSYIPFIYYRTGQLPNADNWTNLNVIYTLLLAHLALRARHEVREAPLRALLIALCFIASIPGDWSYTCLLYVLMFDIFRGDFRKQAFGYTAIALTSLMPTLSSIVMALLTGIGQENALSQGGVLLVRLGLFLPLALLAGYNGQKGRGGVVAKWGFYFFYPAHLLIIGVLRTLYGVR